MKPIRVAIIGASGIGRFHVREFLRSGADVVAIVGTSDESVKKTAASLFEYRISPQVYTSIDSLIASKSVDAVSICAPPEFHFDFAKKCLLAELHVLCEKPFVFNSGHDNVMLAAELLTIAKERGLVVSVNTQWPSVLKYCKPFVNMTKVTDFYMYMQPQSLGKEMLFEQVSHMNSILVHLIPNGEAKGIRFSHTDGEELGVYFSYANSETACSVHYRFKHKKERPRDLSFFINGVQFERRVTDGYQQTLVTGGSVIKIQDPLSVSVNMFVDAIRKKADPLVSPEEIIENMVLQDQIVKEYITHFENEFLI